jgi:hypothetical protein
MRQMHILAIVVFTASSAGATLSANFDADSLIIREGFKFFRFKAILDPNAFYGTIHAVQRRGRDFFVVYGTSEMSRGWPPRGGNCGCGLESYIRWLHVRDGKIIEQQEGRQESCLENRDGWLIAWQQEKLTWSAEGLEREDNPLSGKIVSITFTWTFDPARPADGLLEVKTPTKWQPELSTTEQ